MSEPKSKSHIEEARELMLEQLKALRNAKPGEALQNELARSKGVSGLSQTIIDSARVEVEYATAVRFGASAVPALPPPQFDGPTAHMPFGRTVHLLGD